VAVLMVLDRRLALDGLIASVCAASVVFRQASSFIFDRTRAEISIRFAEHDLRGRIMSTSAEGLRHHLRRAAGRGCRRGAARKRWERGLIHASSAGW
jgi:hypothetical protein